jgi:hypothetical protein
MTIQDKLMLVQTVTMVLGVGFAVWQIRGAADQLRVAASSYNAAAAQTIIAAKASSSATLGALASATREFQWKVLEDKSLHGLLADGLGEEGLSAPDKLMVVRAMLISHYAFIYEFVQLGQMDGGIWKAIIADMHDFFSKPENRRRWGAIKEAFSPEFRDFVDKELLRLS